VTRSVEEARMAKPPTAGDDDRDSLMAETITAPSADEVVVSAVPAPNPNPNSTGADSTHATPIVPRRLILSAQRFTISPGTSVLLGGFVA